MKAVASPEEAFRLEDLRSFHVLDTPPEQAYDDLVQLAANICDTPKALISLVDEDRQWFKARVGVQILQTPRCDSLCALAIQEPDRLLEIPDARHDPRLAHFPWVRAEPGLRFYAGAPLVTAAGAALGTVCVMDTVPRELTTRQRASLQALARQVVELLNLRRARAELEFVLGEQHVRHQQLELQQRRIEQLNQDLQEQTMVDPLTALKNRRALDSALDHEFARSERSKVPLCVLMIDADHFKPYNDAYGHLAGDQALMLIGLAIKSQTRVYDHVARYGGEEFCVILPDTPLPAGLLVAERVRQSIRAVEGLRRQMSCSIGVACSEGVATPKKLLEFSDRAMYLAKQGGRDRVESYLPPPRPVPL